MQLKQATYSVKDIDEVVGLARSSFSHPGEGRDEAALIAAIQAFASEYPTDG